MNHKYYISDRLFFAGLDIDNLWELFIEYIKNIGETVSLVNWISDNKIDVKDEILYVSDFKNEKPYKTEITQNPFIESTTEMHIKKYYEINKNVFQQIKDEWYKEFKEDGQGIMFFVIYNKRIPHFIMDYDSIKALLMPKELELFNKLGFDFKEWDIKLNDTL